MAASKQDLELIRQTVARLCTRYGVEYWREVDAAKRWPAEFFSAAGEAGLFGALIPVDYGGVGLGPSVASVIVEEINKSGGDACTINAQMAIASALVRGGTEDQKRKYLPQIALGTVRLLTVAATEPDSGADMSALTSSARRVGGLWHIDAHKILISLADQTDLMLLLVRSPEGPTLFLFEMAQARDKMQIHPIDMVANRHTTAMFVDDLVLTDDDLVGSPGGGLRCLMEGFAVRRILAAAESIGNARFFLDRSIAHARHRRTFGRFIGENQGVQYPIAQAFARTEAADLMRWDAIGLVESGGDASGRSALAKILASEAAWEAGRAALATFGGWGLASEYHVERKLRDSMVFVFNNMLMSYVAERVLGLPKAF